MIAIRKTDDYQGYEMSKRLYVPYKVTATCPDCGNILVKHLDTLDPLYYPKLGEDYQLGFWCEPCNVYMYAQVQLDLTITLNSEKVVRE